MTTTHDWLTPSPLWTTEGGSNGNGNGNGHRRLEFFRPQLFGYESDAFMTDFLAAAATPGPAALEAARLGPLAGGQPHKLFQPLHGLFYLAAASLCCREAGFPDRLVNFDAGENTFFVLRKLAGGREYASVAVGPAKQWQPFTDTTPRGLMAGEERLPLVPVNTADGRRLHCGYVPVVGRETQQLSPQELAVNGVPLDLPIEELGSRFNASLSREEDPLTHEVGPSLVDGMDDDIALSTSVYLLLELLEFLQANLPDVAAAVAAGSPPAFSGPKATEKTDLLDFLRNDIYKDSLTLAEALKAVADRADELNQKGGVDDVADLGFTTAAYSLKDSPTPSEATLATLLVRVGAALPDERPPLRLPRLDPSPDVTYVIRFVYERPQCDPVQHAVSLPSRPFRFAPMFDPDAPARQVFIQLPTDVSVAGLRKFKKGVTFIMSDGMRRKMNMLLGAEKSFLDDPAPNAPDNLDLAFICSFSFQIIFIVAFMLLLIFVFVFNIIFWWLAFFKICLPVPRSWLPD